MDYSPNKGTGWYRLPLERLPHKKRQEVESILERLLALTEDIVGQLSPSEQALLLEIKRWNSEGRKVYYS